MILHVYMWRDTMYDIMCAHVCVPWGHVDTPVEFIRKYLSRYLLL